MSRVGGVKRDIHKKERGFKHFTLSDENVVKYLILYRSKLDVSYAASTNIDIKQAGDIFEFNQELIVLYASLDKTVEQTRLTKKQMKLLKLLYDGHTLDDARKIMKLKRMASTYEMLDRIVERIVQTNNKNWRKTMKNMGYIE